MALYSFAVGSGGDLTDLRNWEFYSDTGINGNPPGWYSCVIVDGNGNIIQTLAPLPSGGDTIEGDLGGFGSLSVGEIVGAADIFGSGGTNGGLTASKIDNGALAEVGGSITANEIDQGATVNGGSISVTTLNGLATVENGGSLSAQTINGNVNGALYASNAGSISVGTAYGDVTVRGGSVDIGALHPYSGSTAATLTLDNASATFGGFGGDPAGTIYNLTLSNGASIDGQGWNIAGVNLDLSNTNVTATGNVNANLTLAGGATLSVQGDFDTTGTLLSSGGTLVCNTANVSSNSSSIVVNSGTLDVQGNLTISNGDYASSLGESNYSPATLDVTGALVIGGVQTTSYFSSDLDAFYNSTVIAHDLTVGDAGRGTILGDNTAITLDVSQGAVVLGNQAGSTGRLEFNSDPQAVFKSASLIIGNDGTGTFDQNGTATISGDVTLAKGAGTGSLSIRGKLTANNLTAYRYGSVNVSGSGSELDAKTINLGGGSIFVGTNGYVYVAGGTVGQNNQLQIGVSGSIIGYGTISSSYTTTIPIGSSVHLPVWALNIDDRGTIEAKGGELVVDANLATSQSSPLQPSGEVLIDPNSALELAGTFGNGSTVTFQSNGSGQLILDDAALFHGTIAGMSLDDQIILKNVNAQNKNDLVDATIGFTENSSSPSLEINQSGQPTALISLNLPGAASPGAVPTEFFNVTQSGKDTVLTLTKGNPLAQSVNAQDGQGNSTTGLTGAGIRIGVISGGEELLAMKEIIRSIAPDAVLVNGTNADFFSLSQSCQIIVDDVTNIAGDQSVPVLGLATFGAGFNNAVVAGFDAGATYVSAAGNTNNVPIVYPGSHQALSQDIDVAAMNWLATPAGIAPVGGYITPAQAEGFSVPPIIGSKVDISGPERGPTARTLGTDLDAFVGTSAAAPTVAAVAALMLQANRQLTNRQIDAILRNPANAHPISGNSGVGLVDAQLAVAAAQALIRPIDRSPDSPNNGPTINSAYLSVPPGSDLEPGSTASLILQLSSAVTISGTPVLTLNNGATATFDSTSSDPADGSVVFSYTPSSGDYTPNLGITGLAVNSGLIADSNGNAADLSTLIGASTGVTIASHLKVSSVTSSQTGEIQPSGQTIQLTLALSEAATINASGGAPTLLLNNNATATYDSNASAPGSGKLVFDYVVGSADDTSNLYVGAVSLPQGTTIKDGNGDNADFSLSTIDTKLGLQIGAVVPTAFCSAETGDVDQGSTAHLVFALSGSVTVDTAGGSPSLALSDGANAVYDATLSNPAAGALIFDYTPSTADQTPDLTLTDLQLNGAIIEDASGAATDFSAWKNVPTGLTVNSPLKISSISALATGATSASLSVLFAEPFVIDTAKGDPTVSLMNGSIATYDPASSNPAGGILTFDATLAAGELASDLKAVAVNENGAVIQDANGNNAALAIGSLASPQATWQQIDSGAPLTMAAGDFSGSGSAQLITSYAGVGTYSYSVVGGWKKIDNGAPVLMSTGMFSASTQMQLIGVFNGYGTYSWGGSSGWNKIDAGTPYVLTAGDFAALGHDQLAGAFSGYGTYTWSSGVGWQKIDNGTPALLASGDFTGVGHSELAGVFASYGTYTWTSASGWQKIDNGTPTQIIAGNFYNDGKSELAGYFAGYGTYIWGAGSGWTKIDTGAAGGLASVDLNGNGQNELLAYFPGAGVYEWQQGSGWSKYDNTAALPTTAQRALFATGNFQGSAVVDAAVTFPGQGGIWLDPPSTPSSPSLPDASLSIADGATLELGDASAAAVSFTGASGILQLDHSSSFFGSVAGLGLQDQIDLRDISASGARASFTANQNDTGGTLTVSDGSHTAGIALLGNYMASTFVTTGDAQGGTLVSVSPQPQANLLAAQHTA